MPAISSSAPILQDISNGIVTLTLNRPARRNALDPDLLETLSATLRRLAAQEPVRGLILTGEGTAAFSAGADIAYLHAASPLQVRAYAGLAVEVTRQLEHFGKPVIAALNGVTLGGGLELAEACMIRIAAAHARLGHPEVRIGAVAGFGGTTRLPRLVGKGIAADMLLRGRIIDAVEALRIGLVQHVAAPGPGRLLEQAREILDDILQYSPLAVRLNWEAMHRGLGMTLEESAALGADYFGLAAASADFRTGTAAFLEKSRTVTKEN